MTDRERDIIEVSIARMEGKLDSALRRHETMEHDLYGNGKPGLKADMHDVKSWVDSRRKLEWLFVSVMVAGALSFVATASVWLIKVME